MYGNSDIFLCGGDIIKNCVSLECRVIVRMLKIVVLIYKAGGAQQRKEKMDWK